MKNLKLTGAVAAVAVLGASAVQAQELIIESWRSEDLAIWQDQIIPAFEAKHPDIKVTFSPTAPTEYNASLNARLDGGTAGDLITCRAFDAALELFKKGHLADLSDLGGMDNFDSGSKIAWQTDDGSQTFCVPMASVIIGFIYNKDIFAELGLEVPATEAEFFALLDKIKESGTYIPMAMGTADQWESAEMGYYNIGPNYWKGENGRMALLAGEQMLTDEAWVDAFRHMAKWGDYLGDGFEAQTYSDSQNLFTLGRAAIYPAGSWEISGFNAQAEFEMGAFKPPVINAGDECYFSDKIDIALGLNASSANAESAKVFLEWVASAEFGEIYANALPGFFSLVNADIELKDPLAQEFVSWRSQCTAAPVYPSAQKLSRGVPNLNNEVWTSTSLVIRGEKTPEDAAKELQDGLSSWYEPHQ